jgi:hypothetical protein
MTLPALASTSDLSARGVDVSDAARAQAVLDDASALIRLEAGVDWVDTDGQLDADVPDVVLTVCCRAAARAMGVDPAAEETQLADFRVRYRDVYLTKAEKRLVRKAAGTSSIGSIELTSPYRAPTPADYVPVEGGGDPVLMGPWLNQTGT